VCLRDPSSSVHIGTAYAGGRHINLNKDAFAGPYAGVSRFAWSQWPARVRHGYEFQPYGDGTLLDLMMTETKPQFVRYQMDVFWIPVRIR
jgi:hypothetical protein